MWHPWGFDGGWGAWLLMTLTMVAFWALVIVVVVWVVRQFQPSGLGPREGRPDPISILEERFARGEIDREEFEERKATLQHG